MAGKKTGKRLLTWVLVLVMALSLLPLNALAANYSDENPVPEGTELAEGDTYTLGTDDASNLPEAPEGLRWDGPESIKGDRIICGKMRTSMIPTAMSGSGSYSFPIASWSATKKSISTATIATTTPISGSW